MSNPFNAREMFAADRFAALSGMVDYWITPTKHDSTPNILGKDGAETIGTAIRVETDAQVTFKDQYGNALTVNLLANELFPTSVGQIMSTDTDAVTVFVAIAP
ncbi:hypothetical protein [Maritimibacter alexandrii]|uniref:hypothetical protein n=1 Tax=Maritimibacter alexandrii TaxID=2570355 RepID=UPI0011085AAE|nr:hypothetical protein [Maritimibacter alexandrii]